MSPRERVDGELFGYHYKTDTWLDFITKRKSRREEKNQYFWSYNKERYIDTNWFDAAFARGQAVAKIWQPNKSGWERSTKSHPWLEAHGDLFDDEDLMNKQKRLLKQVTDGISFSQLPRLVRPSKAEKYVKLLYLIDKKGSRDLMLYDVYKGAAASGSSKRDWYIPVSTFQQLKECDKYDWMNSFGIVYVRRGMGQLGRVCVPEVSSRVKLRNHDWWLDAYNAGVAKVESKIVRSRNPNHLQMLFVVKKHSRIKVEALQTLVSQILKDMPNVFQSAEVVAHDKSDAKKRVYTYKVSNCACTFILWWLLIITHNHVQFGDSPFGDFETWIKESDYVSYLTAYAHRPYPEDLQMVKTLVDSLKPKQANRVTELQKKFKKGLEERKEFSTRNADEETGVMISRITIRTVTEVANPMVGRISLISKLWLARARLSSQKV